jgi:hypothetical protein
MRKTYKNKRDFYKKEAEINKQSAEFWKEQAAKNNQVLADYKKKCEEKKKQSYSADVYCSNCQKVVSSIVPGGVDIHSSGCANCGARNCGYLVVSYPNKF